MCIFHLVTNYELNQKSLYLCGATFCLVFGRYLSPNVDRRCQQPQVTKDCESKDAFYEMCFVYVVPFDTPLTRMLHFTTFALGPSRTACVGM